MLPHVEDRLFEKREALVVRPVALIIPTRRGLRKRRQREEANTRQLGRRLKWLRHNGLTYESVPTPTCEGRSRFERYLYLNNPGIRDVIDTGVWQAIPRDAECVVVGHSLGSVVSYSLLRREGTALGWQVPLYVTVGAPLAVTKIKTSLAPNKHPNCAKKWFNAMDPDDIVALYPLDDRHFPVDPAVENKTDVDNQTPNQHGIVGYLSDPEVARRIHDALVGGT